jgi:hypothetical protein
VAYTYDGPVSPDDVFVEVLACTQPEGEPTVGEDLSCRGLLCDDGRVVTDRRAGDIGEQLDMLGRMGDGAEHRPCIGRVPL